jgi:hypothetical protein
LAEPVAAKRVLPHLRREGGAQGVAVQEIVERRVCHLPAGLIIDGAAGRGGELPEEERRVAALPAVVDQAAHHGVVLARLRWGRDGQQQGTVALPRPGGHGLKCVVGDDVELVDDGERRVPPLQAPRVGRERHEHRIGPGLVQSVGVDVDAVGQLVVQRHHAAGGVEDDAGLSFIAGDNQHLGTLHAVAEQPIQPHGGGQGALAVPGGDGHEPLTRAGLVEHSAHNLTLPGTQFHALTGPGALRDHDVPLAEADTAVAATPPQAAQVQRRGAQDPLWTRFHAATGPGSSPSSAAPAV